MGLDDRNYAREGFSSDRGGWGQGPNSSSGGSVVDWPVWKKIIAVNVIVFVLQIFITRQASFDGMGVYAVSVVQEWFELDAQKVLSGQVWRLVTAGFCHDRYGIWHLLFNMLFLYWFGARLESRYGPREFCCFYFASLLVASLAYVALDLYSQNMSAGIGASGAVWGVVALYALLYPYDRIYVYFLFPVQIRFLALIYFAFDLHPVLLALAGDFQSSGIGHAAHVGGALFGFAYWYFGIRLYPWIESLTGKKTKKRWANSRPTISRSDRDSGREQIYKFPVEEKPRKIDETHEAKMDALLDKISEHGRESLTDEELEFLVDTSKQLRQE